MKVIETFAEKQERISITNSAGNFLSDQPSGTLYGAYNELKQAQEDGNGNALADNYVVVWQPLDYMTVDQMVELIENSARGNDLEDQPEFIQKIGWESLRTQKTTLLYLIENRGKHNLDDHMVDDLDGIINLLDAVQDYAVDECGFDENRVFNLNLEE